MTDAQRNLLSRRQALGRLLRTGLCLPFAGMLPDLRAQSEKAVPTSKAGDSAAPARHPPAAAALPSGLSPEDDQLLNDIESANFLFFWEQGSPNT
ncbi:MAG: hypothetical protein WA609_14385, partial [Terriglobales bacterium]